MAVIPVKDIQSALNEALELAFPRMPIVWENTEYTPTIGTTYFSAWLLPAEPDNLCIGGSPPWQQHQGIFQVNVFSPIGIGFGYPKNKAAEIVAAFPANSSFVYNSLTIIIRKAWPAIGFPNDNGWYQIPVSIRYCCYSND